jgi:REP element-mobilizing transposase RayT
VERALACNGRFSARNVRSFWRKEHCSIVAIPRRRLPHWHPDDRDLFLTWNLYGSLPEFRYPPSGHPSAGKAFVWMDRYLDTTRTGPMWLRQATVAQLVSESIRGGTILYDLYSWVIMPNHVHVLLRPKADPSELLRRIKGRTAREANLLGRTGTPFWQAESYDRWVRDDEERARISRYIEDNPVAAGLAQRADLYRWSSAWPGWK